MAALYAPEAAGEGGETKVYCPPDAEYSSKMKGSLSLYPIVVVSGAVLETQFDVHADGN